MSKLDIIIPAYNAHNTIEKTLESISIQTMIKDIKVIIIDDCSNQDYNNIIDKFKSFMNIDLIRHEKNCGCGASRNTGLDNSNSDYIMFVDADDMLKDKYSAERLYKIISKSKELNVLFSPITQVEEGKIKEIIPANHSIWIFSCIYNKRFLDKYHIRFSNTSSGEDGGFNKKVKILSKPNQIGYVEDSIYLWTDMNKEGRINTTDFVTYSGRIGYAENLIEAYEFLETQKKYIPANYDDLTQDYLANLSSIYFLYILMQSYKEPKGQALIDAFKSYYKKYCKIYNKNVDIVKFEQIYLANFYNHFKSEKFPLNNKITFTDFIKKLAEDDSDILLEPKREHPLISFIVPLYNAEKTVERLIESIICQGLPKDSYEIIFADDHSTDNSTKEIEKFNNICNIKIIKTQDRAYHTPGFSRKDGLAVAKGDWITFIDNDDFFLSNTIQNIYKYMNLNTPVIFTNFVEINNNWEKIPNNYDRDLFLHGKFYNRKLLEDFNIDFSDKMITHEDVYFNNQVFSALNDCGLSIEYLDIETYMWVKTDNSLSRDGYSEYNCYVEVHFEDYLHSSLPYITKYLRYKKKDFNYNQIMNYILKGYFYYQQTLWKKGVNNNITRRNEIILKDYIYYLKEECSITNEDIISYNYSNVDRYNYFKDYCIDNSCIFVETSSLKDFIGE